MANDKNKFRVQCIKPTFIERASIPTYLILLTSYSGNLKCVTQQGTKNTPHLLL